MRVLHTIGEMGAGGAESLVAEMMRRGPSVGWESGLASGGGMREDILRAEGVGPLYRVDNSARAAKGVVTAVAQTAKVIRDFQPDVILAHNVGVTLVAGLARLAASRPGLPIVTVFHGVADDDFTNTARILNAIPRSVIAVSGVSGRRLAGAGLAKPTHAVPNAISAPDLMDRSAARAQLGLPDQPTALCLARMVEQKRHDVLLDAWARVEQPATLLLAGGGHLRPQLEQQAKDLGIEDSVHFLGIRKDVPVVLAAADLSALSSDWEGLPIAVLESMAAGRPMVATDVDGVTEAAVPGTAVIVPRQDPQALADGLNRVLHDPALRDELGAAARASVLERHDPQKMMVRYDEILRDAVEHPAAAVDRANAAKVAGQVAAQVGAKAGAAVAAKTPATTGGRGRRRAGLPVCPDVVHVTDASAAGTLVAVSRLARAQAADPAFGDVTFAYTLRTGETPSRADLEAMFGPQVRLVEITPDESPRQLVDLTRYVARALRDEDTVVHVHCSRAGLLGRLVALPVGRDRVVYSPHGLAFSHGHGAGASLVYRALEQAGTVASPRVIAVSDSERRTIETGLRGARVATLYNTVDVDRLDRLDAPVPTDLTTRPVRIIQVGRLGKAKAPQLFVETVSRIRERFAAAGLPRPEATWIGSGDEQLLAGTDIRLTGWLEGDDLLREIAAGDVLLFTTLGEGMPMTILDAQALRRPVVASRVVGVTELVTDGETGLLGSSADDLAAAVQRVVEDDALRAGIVERARGAVEREYAWSGYAESSLRAYREIGLVAGPTA